MKRSPKPYRSTHYRTCECGKLFVGYLEAPMVNESLWRRLSRGRIDAILCTGCFKRRLGRPVTPMDKREPWWAYRRGQGARFADVFRMLLWPGIEHLPRLRELMRDEPKIKYARRLKIRRFHPRTGLVFFEGNPLQRTREANGKSNS